MAAVNRPVLKSPVMEAGNRLPCPGSPDIAALRPCSKVAGSEPADAEAARPGEESRDGITGLSSAGRCEARAQLVVLAGTRLTVIVRYLCGGCLRSMAVRCIGAPGRPGRRICGPRSIIRGGAPSS